MRNNKQDLIFTISLFLLASLLINFWADSLFAATLKSDSKEIPMISDSALDAEIEELEALVYPDNATLKSAPYIFSCDQWRISYVAGHHVETHTVTSASIDALIKEFGSFVRDNWIESKQICDWMLHPDYSRLIALSELNNLPPISMDSDAE